MDPPQNTKPNSETERNLTIAAKLLSARDFVGAKRFAELVLESSTVSSDDRADQILAIADVILADRNRDATSNLPDCYSILQIPRNSFDEALLKRNYRRLSLLLHPDRDRFPGSDDALRVLNDAYSVLSDPAKRSDFDSKFTSREGCLGQEDTFWTICKFCCHAHLYNRMYLNKMLKCQNCKKAFEAKEATSQPIVVPGTDKYHAIWGFFPIGFANPSGTNSNPFVSVKPNGNVGGDPKQNEDKRSGAPVSRPGMRRKTTARKSVISELKTHFLQRDAENGSCSSSVGDEVEMERGININEEAKGVGGEDVDLRMHLDEVDYDMLSSHQNLPFCEE